MNSISPRDRRDYIPYFKQRDEDVRNANLSLIAMFVVIVFGLSLLVHMFIEPAKAQEVSPRSAYPLTNRGSCEMLHDHLMPGQTGKESQITKLCATLGIQL